MMTITKSNLTRLALFFMFASTLIGCVDAANYAIFRESLDPLHEQIEVGMSSDEVQLLLAESPEVNNHIYPYTSDESQTFGLDADKDVQGDIFQLTMSGDPADKGVTSICFFKVLLVDDGSGGKHAIGIGEVTCPA